MAKRKLTSMAGAAALCALALLPLLSGSQYLLSVAAMTLLYAYLALSWNILGGIAGQLSLGHAAYFGLGAYTSTWLFVNLGISPWLGMWAGAAVAMAAALIVGLSCLQLRGAYFALATIASCMVLKTLAENADTLLGGPRGMEVTLLRDAPLYFQHTGKAFYYIVALVFTAAALLVNRHVLRSRFGYCLTAVRNDQDAALALGVPVRRYKLAAAMLSAAMTALGGTFYAQFVLYISPDKVFGANLSVIIAVICIIGGRGTLWGPVLGAMLLLPGEELARSLTGGMVGADMMLYGLLLMIVVRWEPRGLMALLARKRSAPARGAAPAVKPVGQAMGGTR
ncbi:branched-chain amino acid ABC transporter permease [Achromobacter sp. NPDC058515]|uniref:branched-chain amino acid ABC transporter permease n=1 Tax=Achromobacter sp. NPDC058515 TaxID=3346533 RepID=UPI00366A0FAF